MKKILVLIIAFIPALLIHSQNDAKTILDKTSNLFSKDSGIKADFTLEFIENGRSSMKTEGTIQLKQDKFIIETDYNITWFNGTTQWSYVIATEDVNITNPSQEELQTINPYIILNSYKEGYNYQIGSTTTFRNKPVHEVILNATNSLNDLTNVKLYIQKSTYHPLYIELMQKDNSVIKINVVNYKFKQDFPDSLFIFDRKKYPQAEEIDLR